MIRRATVIALVFATGWSVMRFASRADEPGKRAAATPVADSEKNPANNPAVPDAASELSTLETALSQSVAVKFEKTTLKDVVANLTERFKINVILDHQALADASIPEDKAISFELKDCTLRYALHWILQQIDLDFYTIADGDVLLITTSEKAKQTVYFHVYDVRDLVGYDEVDADGKRSLDYDSLIDLITSCVAPATWATSGGPGSIQPLLGTISLEQTEPIHEQIAALLEALRRAHRLAGATEPVPADSPAALRAAAAIRARLARQQDLHLHEMPLTELRDWLTAQGISTLLDGKALGEASIPTDAKLSACDLKNVGLGWALQGLLNERDLAYCIDGEALVITTWEKAKATTCRVVYPVGDLKDMPSLTGAEQDDPPDFDTIVNAITSTVAPSTWGSAGGVGSISPLPLRKLLACNQTSETQDQIARLLAMLRAQVRGSRTAGEKPLQPDNSPVVRIYFLMPADSGKGAAAADARAERYVSVVRDLIEPKSWAGGSGYIAAVADKIVVRQTPEVQKRVRKLLEDMGAIPPTGRKIFFPGSGLSGPGNLNSGQSGRDTKQGGGFGNPPGGAFNIGPVADPDGEK